MVVKCPGCQSLLKIGDDKVSAHGTHLRCPSCSTVFMVKLPDAQPPTTNASDSNATRVLPNVPKFKDDGGIDNDLLSKDETAGLDDLFSDFTSAPSIPQKPAPKTAPQQKAQAKPTPPQPPPKPVPKKETSFDDFEFQSADDLDLDAQEPPPDIGGNREVSDVLDSINFDELPGIEGEFDEFAGTPSNRVSETSAPPGSPQRQPPPEEDINIDFDDDSEESKEDPTEAFDDFQDTVADFNLNDYLSKREGLEKKKAEQDGEFNKTETHSAVPSLDIDFSPEPESGGIDLQIDFADEGGGSAEPGLGDISIDEGNFEAEDKTLNIPMPAQSKEGDQKLEGGDDMDFGNFNFEDSDSGEAAESMELSTPEEGGDFSFGDSADLDLGNIEIAEAPQPPGSSVADEFSNLLEEAAKIKESVGKRSTGQENISSAADLFSADSGDDGGFGNIDFGDSLANLEGGGAAAELGVSNVEDPNAFGGDLGSELGTIDKDNMFGNLGDDLSGPKQRPTEAQRTQILPPEDGSLDVTDVSGAPRRQTSTGTIRPQSMTYQMAPPRKVKFTTTLGTFALATFVCLSLMGALWMRQARGLVAENSTTATVISALGLKIGSSAIEEELKGENPSYIQKVNSYISPNGKEFVIVFGKVKISSAAHIEKLEVEVMMLDKRETVIARGRFPINKKITPLDLDKIRGMSDVAPIYASLKQESAATGHFVPFTAVFPAPKENLAEYAFKARTYGVESSKKVEARDESEAQEAPDAEAPAQEKAAQEKEPPSENDTPPPEKETKKQKPKKKDK